MTQFNIEQLTSAGTKMVDTECNLVNLEDLRPGEDYDFIEVFEESCNAINAKENLNENLGNELTGVALWMIGKNTLLAKQLGVNLLKKLTEKGSLTATYNFSVIQLDGKLLNGQNEQGIENILKVINNSSSNRLKGLAYGVYGDMLVIGRAVEENHLLAREMYIRGAEAGNGHSAYKAGLMFQGESILDIDTDLNKAAHYYKIGVEHGDIKAQTNLGIMHLSQIFIGKDFEEGMLLIKKSAQEGDEIAKQALVEAEKGFKSNSNDPMNAIMDKKGLLMKSLIINNSAIDDYINGTDDAIRILNVFGMPVKEKLNQSSIEEFFIGRMSNLSSMSGHALGFELNQEINKCIAFSWLIKKRADRTLDNRTFEELLAKISEPYSLEDFVRSML